MSSTNLVNFSLRQNKSIERMIVFDCIASVMRALDLRSTVYVGFGSVWFADFIIAHRLLGIRDMVSIERDEITFKRAQFNRPYKTVEVIKGDSSDVIPDLLDRQELSARPWIVWLDYDNEIDEAKLAELVRLMQSLPPNSFLITTFSALAGRYGNIASRPEFISGLFAKAAPETLDPLAYRNQDDLMRILAESTENYLVSQAIDSARPGSFLPAVQLTYRDSMPMVTVGGVLPAPENEEAVKRLVSGPEWPGRAFEIIQVPPLTPREVLALQSHLPSMEGLTREDVVKMGFDLKKEQLDAFVDHYLRYPQFAQVAQ
ncbi:MAG: O-methyltransferase [Streptosporangiaceae bacterium]